MPAICDEIVAPQRVPHARSGERPSSDHGRNQAWFEFASQLGELIGMDFVGLPVYSWGCAAGHAIRMAARLTGRRQVLVPATMSPERLAVIRDLLRPPELAGHVEVELVGHDAETGPLDLDDLRAKLSSRTAAVLFENPCYLGTLEQNAAEIAALARAAGAETIVGVDPISLGIARPTRPTTAPTSSSAPCSRSECTCPCGGGAGGFIATRDEERYAREYPTLNLSIGRTVEPGEYGFGIALFEQTSYGLREDGNDWTGNSVYLQAVANAAYMALIGPEGFAELGRADRRSQPLRGPPAGASSTACASLFPSGFFKEFVVVFDETGKTVAEVNRGLREHGIFGGKDLSRDFPDARPERAVLRHRGAHARTTSTGSPTRWRRCSHDGPPLPRGRLGRAARDGDGRARPARRRLRRRRARGARRGRRRRGARAGVAAPERRRPSCPSCPSPRCCATISTSRRRRSE